MTAAHTPDASSKGSRKSAIVLAALVFGFVIVLLGTLAFTTNPFAATYDGWTIGETDLCPEPDYNLANGARRPAAWDCDATLARWVAIAEAALDRRDPGHAAVVRASVHWDGSNAKYLCDPLEIALFELADGTKRAIGVGHFCTDRANVLTRDYGARS